MEVKNTFVIILFPRLPNSSVFYPNVLEFFPPSLGYYPELTYANYLFLLDKTVYYSFLNKYPTY